MPFAAFAASHQSPIGQGEGDKIVKNCYLDIDRSVYGNEKVLRCLPGVIDADGGNHITGSVRGLAQADDFADGKLLVFDGLTMRTRTSGGGFATISGSLVGSDRVQVAFSATEAGILADGLPFVSDGATVAAATDSDYATLLSDHGRTAFTSAATIGQRLLLTYGSRFCYSEVLDFNSTTALNYFTAERFPDGVVAGVVHGEEYVLFGRQSIEPWVETGNVDQPFNPLPGRAVPNIGALCRDGIVNIGLDLVFIDQDRAVRIFRGSEPPIISLPWVTQLLDSVDASEIVAHREALNSHVFYTIRTPKGCVSYDLSTQEWHVRQTRGEDSWRWQFSAHAHGRTYLGGANGAQLGYVDTSAHYDLDDEIVMEATAHIPEMPRGMSMGIIDLKAAVGVGAGAGNGQGANPVVQMRSSRDGGNTWGRWRERSLGRVGAYDARVRWNINKASRGKPITLHFRSSDPVNRVWRSVEYGAPP